MNCPNRIKFFLWCCIHDRLKTASILHSLSITSNPLCIICSKYETSRHIVLECPIVKRFWHELGLGPLIKNIRDNLTTDWIELIRRINLSKNNTTWPRLLPFALWNIWLKRNSNCFNAKRKFISLPYVISQTIEFFTLGSGSGITTSHRTQPRPRNWIPPKIGYKLNIDGAFHETTKRSGIGYVVRDFHDDWILGICCKTVAQSALIAELLTLYYGLRLSIEHNYKNITIQTDSKELISCITKLVSANYNLILECMELIHQLGNPPIQHDFRERNRATDLLVWWGSQLPDD